jgi:hypothetical protein
VAGSTVEAHPHNFYLETMIRAGVGGLLALLALTVGLLRRLWRIPVRGSGLLDPSMLPPLLAMQVIWALTWVPGLEQGIVTGIAIAVAVAGVRRRAPGPCPPEPVGVRDRVTSDPTHRDDPESGSRRGDVVSDRASGSERARAEADT